MAEREFSRANAYAAFAAITDQDEISLFVRDDIRL
jgi:hypothetical protein